jgi:hypothetical protein
LKKNEVMEKVMKSLIVAGRTLIKKKKRKK